MGPGGVRHKPAADPTAFSVSTQASPAPCLSWQAQYFTDSQRNDLSISGWNADPDGDGISNGLEDLFNFNPIPGIIPAEAAAIPRVTPSNRRSTSSPTAAELAWAPNSFSQLVAHVPEAQRRLAGVKSPHLGHNSRVSVAVAPTCAVNRPRELAIK
jgi:hypothetical protein